MNSEQVELSKKLILSPTKVVPEIDKFNMWMLAGSGATAALLVSNLAGITSALESGAASWLFALLAISGLFGFLAKLCCIRVQSSTIVMGHVEDALQSSDNVDVKSALNDFLSVFPFWARLAGRNASKKAKDDPLYGVRIVARHAIYQGIYTLLQGLTFILFIVVASLGIK
ncbi:hypothetical protein [Shewanella oncorhynchi]|uniref:hypothetical protein n=1 Tax=Shewanella oncorhynchi TaxID=2726434 RepID=UPI003D791C57